MQAMSIHALFFLLNAAVGCGILSGIARLMAYRMNLQVKNLGAGRLALALIGVPLAGALGQLIFALLQDYTGAGPSFARLTGWLIAGTLSAIATSWATPYMPWRRSGVVGAFAGLAAWLAFTFLLGLHGESAARMGSILAFWSVLPAAVLFPLPQTTMAFCADCDCGRIEAEKATVGENAAPLTAPVPVTLPVLPTAQAPTPARIPTVSIAELLGGEGDSATIPGRLIVPGRVATGGSRASANGRYKRN